MVHVKADDGRGHEIDYNCKVAVMMLLDPDNEKCDAVTSLMGKGSTEEIVNAVSKCAGEILTALTKDPVERMVLGLMMTNEIYMAARGEGSTETEVMEDIRMPVKEDKE